MTTEFVTRYQSPRRAFMALVLGVLAWLPFIVFTCFSRQLFGPSGPYNLFENFVVAPFVIIGLFLAGIGAFMCRDRGQSSISHRRTWRVASFLVHSFLLGPITAVVLVFLFSVSPLLGVVAIAVAAFFIIRFLVRRAKSSLSSPSPITNNRYDY